MPATALLPRVVFWLHVVVALVLVAIAAAFYRLVPELDLKPGGVEMGGLARTGLEKALPAGGGLLALAAVSYGLNRLGNELQRLDPRASQLSTLEQVALAVPGSALGDLAGVAGAVLVNAALALFVLDLLYRWLRG